MKTNRAPAVAPVARLVTNGPPPGASNPTAWLKALVGSRGWKELQATTFLVTPGGFLVAECSEPVARRGWDSRPIDVERLLRAAETRVVGFLNLPEVSRVSEKARYLTLGIDVWTPEELCVGEFVCVVHLATRRILRWTGKSYPTSQEEADLVQFVDLDSHFLELAGHRILVLGCHDLNMFGNRGYANQSPGSRRRQRCDDFRSRAMGFAPTLALQHPHSTDSARIWSMPWSGLRSHLPSVRTYASGVAYWTRRGRPRGTLESVLASTASDDVVDLVVSKPRGASR